MIGKFVIYEGVFQDRIVVRKIVGETTAYWKVQGSLRANVEASRLKKSSIGPCAFFDDEREAKKAANRYADKLIKARKHFRDRQGQIFAELASSGGKSQP